MVDRIGVDRDGGVGVAIDLQVDAPGGYPTAFPASDTGLDHRRLDVEGSFLQYASRLSEAP